MKKKVLLFLVTCALAGLAFVPCAAAAPPEAVSGDWAWSSSYVIPKVAGGNTFLVGAESSTWSGSFSGTSSDVLYVIIHGKGVVTARIIVDFTGTVNGVAGTMTMVITVLIAPDGSEGGNWVIQNASGGLAGLHGEGKWWAWETFGSSGAYTGHVQP